MKQVITAEDITEVVYVEWVDPCTWVKGSYTLADAEELKPHTLRSAGLLIREDEDSITIATDVDLQDESMRFMSGILKKNIVTMKRWRPEP